MAVVDSRDRGLGLGCGHLRGRLVLVIELRKLEFIWVGMLSYRRAEDADRHRAGGIDGNSRHSRIPSKPSLLDFGLFHLPACSLRPPQTIWGSLPQSDPLGEALPLSDI